LTIKKTHNDVDRFVINSSAILIETKKAAPRTAAFRQRLFRAAVPVAAGVLIALLPVPVGLKPQAWYHFAIFVATILALVMEPVPGAVAGLMGITLSASLRLVDPSPAESIKWALSGFSDSTAWLIFVSFLFALGYQKSGLGRRIALTMVKHLGGRTLGLGYAITFSDLILAPVTPSNTGRSGGTIFPVIRSIPELYGSYPGESARRIGAYIMWSAFAAQCITSSMFLTGLAPNLLATSMVNATAGIKITWMEWFLGFLPAGILLIAFVPLLIYWLYPPEVKRSAEVPAWARKQLEEMGGLKREEKIMAGLAMIALVLWVFADAWMSPATVALAVFCLMILLGIISWEDVLGYRQAFEVLMWFGTLIALADGLRRVGFLQWLGELCAKEMVGFSPLAAMILLVTAFYLIHYMFASLTAHVTALVPVFIAAAMKIPGLPMKPFSMFLCYTIGIMGVLTPYATGPAPMYYGSGFISRKAFWLLGLVFGALYFSVYLAVGVPYFRWLGW
jgi:L-tartrate/succinate antiporter